MTIMLSSCVDMNENESDVRPYFGEIDQAGVEFVENELDTIK